MKNTTKKSPSPTRYPSKESHWSYWMQAIEPGDKAINEAFTDFHPQFVIQSQREDVSPEMFIYRRLQLGMNTKQCAAFLRIGESTLRTWESGRGEIPFMAYELLRLVQESLFSRLSHKAWDGWFISAQGKLVSPNMGRCEYTPEKLEWVSWQGTEATKLQTEVNRLQRELEKAQEENTKLRQMFVDQGVVDELYTMKDRLRPWLRRWLLRESSTHKTRKSRTSEEGSMKPIRDIVPYMFSPDIAVNASISLGKIRKRIRRINPAYKPTSRYQARQHKRAARAHEARHREVTQYVFDSI